jgi:hypothetical protein
MTRSRMVVQISIGKRPVEYMISQLQGRVHKGLQRRFERFGLEMGETQEYWRTGANCRTAKILKPDDLQVLQGSSCLLRK